jgi:hypothetical protein
MERAKGIEPSYEAWEASVLPLNYARDFNNLGRHRNIVLHRFCTENLLAVPNRFGSTAQVAAGGDLPSVVAGFGEGFDHATKCNSLQRVNR